MALPKSTPGLPCPECRARLADQGKPTDGVNRIGNRRGRCSTCNAFVQAVRRGVASRLAARHADELDALRLEVEHDLYPGVIETWSAKRGI